MLKVSVNVDFSNFEKIKKNLVEARKKLEVGWFPESKYGSENDNLPVAQVAQWNNEGSINNPIRPFFTVGFLRPLEKGSYGNYFKDSLKNIIEGNTTFTKEYESLGIRMVSDIKTTITEWSTPPNSSWTINQKGFDNPLIWTGTMRDSTNFKITKEGS